MRYKRRFVPGGNGWGPGGQQVPHFLVVYFPSPNLFFLTCKLGTVTVPPRRTVSCESNVQWGVYSEWHMVSAQEGLVAQWGTVWSPQR